MSWREIQGSISRLETPVKVVLMLCLMLVVIALIVMLVGIPNSPRSYRIRFVDGGEMIYSADSFYPQMLPLSDCVRLHRSIYCGVVSIEPIDPCPGAVSNSTVWIQQPRITH